MKAVILAAGKGTRMGELTETLPKPMLLVQGKPILQHIVDGLVENGVRSICIITGYRAEMIEDHFGDGSKFGAEIHYVRQLVQNGTGKAPELAKEFVGDSDFLLTYGDILVKPDTYRDAVHRWNSGAPLQGLLTATSGEEISKGGLLIFDDSMMLKQLVEKPSDDELAVLKEGGLIKDGGPFWYNAGIYIFAPRLFEFTAKIEKSTRGEYELTDAITALLNAGHSIAGIEIKGRWVDVRDPEVLRSINDESL